MKRTGTTVEAGRTSARRRAAVVRRTVVAAALVVPIIAGSRWAQAESDVAAERFAYGVAELKAQRFENACPALEESYTSDPRLGTLLALADCLERSGKAHSATTRYEQYLERVLAAGSDERARRAQQLEFARAALERTRARVAHLVLWTEPGVPSPRVRLDGRELTLVVEQAVPVDPGRHVLETRAEGRTAWRVELDLAASETRRVLLELGPAPEERGSPVASTALAVAAPEAGSLARPAPMADVVGAAAQARSPWRTVGWALMGVGVAGVAAGTVAGIMILDSCPGLECEDSQRDEVRTQALVVDLGIGIGVASLVASAALLIATAGSEQPSKAAWQPRIVAGPRGGWLGLDRRW